MSLKKLKRKKFERKQKNTHWKKKKWRYPSRIKSSKWVVQAHILAIQFILFLFCSECDENKSLFLFISDYNSAVDNFEK